MKYRRNIEKKGKKWVAIIMRWYSDGCEVSQYIGAFENIKTIDNYEHSLIQALCDTPFILDTSGYNVSD